MVAENEVEASRDQAGAAGHPFRPRGEHPLEDVLAGNVAERAGEEEPRPGEEGGHLRGDHGEEIRRCLPAEPGEAPGERTPAEFRDRRNAEREERQHDDHALHRVGQRYRPHPPDQRVAHRHRGHERQPRPAGMPKSSPRRAASTENWAAIQPKKLGTMIVAQAISALRPNRLAKKSPSVSRPARRRGAA